jgi:NitT/TauT family transport system ATP-binding protein
VPQQAQLLPWKTLMENVAFPLALRGVARAEREARARAAIAAVDLAGFEAHYPYQLSGGMQKRGSIARMLIYRPDVILMDEPFGALDAQTRMVMQSDLQTLVGQSGAAVLFVTHDITEAIMLADEVVVLSRRPARVLARVAINLPRPRRIFEPFAMAGFAETYDQVWQIFRGEVA